jgi:hypothetical protein
MAKANPERDAYDRKRDQEQQRQLAASIKGRDLGPIPNIADPKRRESCRRSLLKFCRTYNPEAFYLEFSDDHKRVLKGVEAALFKKVLQALAMPRGSGKTTMMRMAVLWAVSYAHACYPFLIGANAAKAQESLDTIKTWIRFLPNYAADFPEISVAAAALGGMANRAAGQLCDGEATLIRWEKDRIVLPRVPRPKNMKGKGHWAPTSGCVIGVSGLTGDGIRGSLFPHPDGRLIRPDLVLGDDLQTDESAHSLTQNVTRENLMSGAVLGMAGPGKRIAGIVVGTVISPGDTMDHVLDRKKHPLWRGIRCQLLRTMPGDMPAWEPYFDIYRKCMGSDTPSIEPANAYYLAHRAKLDAGAAAAWPERKLPEEISAIQHAMNLYLRDPRAFASEYQNAPLPPDTAKLEVTPELVLAKLNQLDRGRVPKSCEWIGCHIDMHDRLLYWTASAWSKEFGGGPIDYGTYPKQPTSYFAQQSAPLPMSAVHKGMTEEAWLQAGLTALLNQLSQATFVREDGLTMRIGRILVDSRWKKEVVWGVCRRHTHAGIITPAMGQGIGAANKPFDEYTNDGGRNGNHWRLPPVREGQQFLLIDTNWWKTQAASRLMLPAGTGGGWEVFGRDPREHQLLADHYYAEEPVEVTAKGRTIHEWKWKPGRPDNHYWDNLIGSAVAGSMLGASFGAEIEKPQFRRKRGKVSYL